MRNGTRAFSTIGLAAALRGAACIAMIPSIVSAAPARNLELVGSASIPPIPGNPGTAIGELSDLWVTGDFAYVGRFHNQLASNYHVDVFDVADRTAPNATPICSTVEVSPVEDVVVEGQYLYVAQQGSGSVGVRIHDLGINYLTAPVCNGAVTDLTAPQVPSAHDLFFYTHSNGTRYLFVCSFQDTTNPGIHILDVTSPGSPLYAGFWAQPVADPLCSTAPGSICAPHDAYVQRVTSSLGTMDLLVVSDWSGGVWIANVTNPTTPVNVAHFGYTWTTPDVNGDLVPDGCDVWGTDTASLPGGSYPQFTHDARITPDGQYLWTADEKNAGGHILAWRLEDILASCPAPAYCALNAIAPIFTFRLQPKVRIVGGGVFQPSTVHQIRWYGANYAVVPSYEAGLRVVAYRSHDSQASPADSSIAPIEIGFFDTVVPDTDGCAENGVPPIDCTTALGNRIFNCGFFGTWGVAWDDCYFYLSERGSSDNNAAPSIVGTAGSLPILRYTDGPTTPQPLRVTKDPSNPGDLVASWGEVPFAATFNLYRGTIPRTPSGGGLGTRLASPPLLPTDRAAVYDHTIVDLVTGCDRPGNSVQVFNQFTPQGAACNNGIDDDSDGLIDCADLGAGEDCSTDQSCRPLAYYYLVTARSPCDPAADRESYYGQDSFGDNRPTAGPSAACPACLTCPL